MQKLPWLLTLFMFLMCACNSSPATILTVTETRLPSPSPVPVTSTPIPKLPTTTLRPFTPTVTLIPLRPTNPATRTPIPFPTATSTPIGPRAISPDGNPVDCRIGPAKEYRPGVTYELTHSAEIVGINETRGWWYVRVVEKSGDFVNCWVNQKSVTTSGDLSNIPVVEAAPAQVTAVNIYLDGGEYTRDVNCKDKEDKPTFLFRGEIVADGPISRLKYQWETNAGPKYPPETGQVRAWDDPSSLKLNLTVPAREGTYSLTLRTILPNELVWVVQLIVKCR